MKTEYVHEQPEQIYYWTSHIDNYVLGIFLYNSQNSLGEELEWKAKNQPLSR